MKKLSFYLLATLFSLGTICSFTSCSDDDDDKDKDVMPALSTLAGTYSGLLDVEMAGKPIITDEAKDIKVELAGNNAIDLELSNLTINVMGKPMALGDIKLTDLPLTEDKTDKEYDFHKADIPMELMGGTISCTITVDGDINGNKVDADLNILWNNLTIKVEFEGTKK